MLSCHCFLFSNCGSMGFFPVFSWHVSICFEFRLSNISDSLFSCSCMFVLLFAMFLIPGFDDVRCSIRFFPTFSFDLFFLRLSVCGSFRFVVFIFLWFVLLFALFRTPGFEAARCSLSVFRFWVCKIRRRWLLLASHNSKIASCAGPQAST